VRGLKLGLLLDAGWGLPVEPEVAAAAQAAARCFEQAGAHIEPIAAFSTRAMADGMNDFWRMRSWLDLDALPEARRAQVLPYIRDWAAGAAGLSAARVFEGYSQMAALRQAAVAATRDIDFLLSPVSPVPAFAAELASPLHDPQRPFEQPAASLNCGHTSGGLPIGLQIAGRRHDDLGVLQLARAYEQLRPAQRPWPEPDAFGVS